MATEVLHAHNIILPPQRVRAAAARRNPNPGYGRKSPPAGRRHQGRRAAAATRTTAAAAEVYAGPAFSTSPEPSALPLPQFPAKKAAAAVDDAATRDLRRILRLE
ncbi:hypothetical protein ACP4OV_021155 [Aristida adscensionis]